MATKATVAKTWYLTLTDAQGTILNRWSLSDAPAAENDADFVLPLEKLGSVSLAHEINAEVR